MAGTTKGKRPISFWPIAGVLQVPPTPTYVSPSLGGEAPVTLNTPNYGARLIINGITIPADAGLHTAQNWADIINNTAGAGASAFVHADGSIVINPSPLGGALVFTGDSTLRTALGLQ